MVERPTHLTNEDLLAATSRLAADERATIAALVAHLAEVDARRLAVAAGHSLFTYCCEVLRLSEDAACNRTTAARMVRAFPTILPMLADGRLNLTTLRVLAPHLTPANDAELLAEAAGQSKRRVEEMVARRFPQAVTTSIRRLPARPLVAMTVASPAQAPVGPSGGANPESTPAGAAESEPEATGAPQAKPSSTGAKGGEEPPLLPAPRAPLAGRRAVTPMADDVFLIRLAARRAMVDRLRRAQDLLAHAVPRGDVTEVFDELRCRAHNQYEADLYFAPIRDALSARDSIRPGADERAGGPPPEVSP